MLILWILLSLLLIVLLVLLFTRLVLIIDTVSEEYLIRWGPVLVDMIFPEEGPKWRVRVLNFQWEGSLLTDRSKEPEARTAVKSSERKPREPLSAARLRWMRKAAINALRSFRVRVFHLRFAPDDVIMGAWLFPLFHLWRMRGNDVCIAFTGQTELQLVIDQTPFRLMMAVART